MKLTKSFTAILLLCMTVAQTSFAKPITREQARQKASLFVKQVPGAAELTPAKGQKRLAPSASAVEPYYVFDRGSDEGYVIVSGDDETIVDVLGYTDRGTFDYDALPPNMREWLDFYATQIAAIQSRQAAPAKVAVSTHPKVEQLMKSTWSQGYPYNLTCPEYFTLGRSVTGCVATAMAQILYYNREKSVTETQAAMPAYDTWTSHPTYGTLHVEGIPAGSPIDWDNMKDSYGSANDLQRLAVADLMHYCGVAVKMDYTNASSGAQVYDAYEAFKTYFGYGSSTRYVTSAADDAEWDEIVYAELAAGRPVYLSGYNNSGGHAFVTDGYDGNLRYHINWGWGGQSDGYYYLTNLTPGQGQGIGGSSDGYNEGRQIIIGLEPENYGDKAMSIADVTVRNLCKNNFDVDGDGKFTYNDAAAVTSLGDVFKGKSIQTFKELYYFTSLTNISDDAFNGCTRLTTVRMSKNVKTIGARAFKGCTKLSQLSLPNSVTAIGEEAFSGCKALAGLVLPEELGAIEARTFEGCAALTAMEIPLAVTAIGEGTFKDCAKLASVTLRTYQPQSIALGSGIFEGIDLTKATLTVAQGTRTYFTTADQWQDFGTIRELRDRSGGKFAKLEKGKKYYIYNIGTGRYLTKGEAYGTQAIVGSEPMRFVFNRTSSMPEGSYYLTSEDTGNSGKYLFRTSTDSNVGNGVKATFVDGNSLSANAYWALAECEASTETQPVYTFQIPANGTGYEAGLYWGVQTDHQSGAASPTYGVYSDVDYESHKLNCQWSLVLYNEEASKRYDAASTLEQLLNIAHKRNLKVDDEQAVCDNLESTIEELKQALSSLRKKLNLIDFADDLVAATCRTEYDINTDGEIGFAEAAQIADFTSYFQGTNITSFDELQYFTNIPDIYGRTFDGCKKLTSVVLPKNITNIYYWAFRNCTSLTSINIPELVVLVGDDCFSNCKALRSVRVDSPDPSTIVLGSNVFSGVPLAECTLYVPFGSKEAYAAAPVWQDFGNIVEMRMKTHLQPSAIQANTPGYLMNLATRKFLAKGEAYGTQSVVAANGLLYQFKRTNSMADDTYYLYSDQASSEGKVLFRTDTDTKVGKGVKACFVDGTLSAKAYWQLDSVAEGPVYTLRVPGSADADNPFLGIDANHTSGVASPTYGTYWDVPSGTKASQWVFIAQEDMEGAKNLDNLAANLIELIGKANAEGIETHNEQAVYDNPASTAAQMEEAIATLRSKLHFITFADDKVRQMSVAAWDADGDGELTESEVAEVTDIGEIFRNNTTIKSFEELRYFTGLKAIPANAFSGCSGLVSIYIPEQVDTIFIGAFSRCYDLKYVALLNTSQPVCNKSSQIRGTMFVPAGMIDKYGETGQWSTVTFMPYTGKPVVTALSATREYGRTITPTQLKYTVTGAPVNGIPQLTCPEGLAAATPVGIYTIKLTPGTITNSSVEYGDSLLTITPATVTVKAKNYSREKGQQNPVFDFTFTGFRNKETSEVLLKQPMATCAATPVSPVGQYEISADGAEAENYEFVYTPGTLTVTESTRGDVNGDGVKNMGDVWAILQAVASATHSAAADVNGDGQTDYADVVTILNIIAAF
ncbi:MAG: leucine-rich repeat protein [Prevotella sp.]|nr:leucine-rich repeat protein [Prevotella sp.]